MKINDETRAATSGQENKIKLGLSKFFKQSLMKFSATPTKSWKWANTPTENKDTILLKYKSIDSMDNDK